MSINIPSMFTTPKEFWQELMKIDEKQCIEMDEDDEENVGRDDPIEWSKTQVEAEMVMVVVLLLVTIVAMEVEAFGLQNLGSEWEFNSGYWAPKG
jgi:hypothetical protein